jgi:predicted nucleic acid-binding protein
MRFIIDSYAWVEYFLGSKKGEVVNELFSNQENEFITVDCCLAEIHGWVLREKQNFEKFLTVIRANSDLMKLSEQNWIDAGKERFEQRKNQKDFGLIDSALVAKQKELNCKIVSSDKHFKNLKDVVFLD